jgi:hypothetical protein
MYPHVFQPDKGVLISIINTEPSSQGTDPEIGLLIFEEAFDLVVGYGAGVFGVIPVNGESVAIIFVQPVPGAEPHESQFILQDTVDGTL